MTDDPAYLVSEALEQHRRMIAAMRGVPGVQPERLANALKPRHCALSLVGEPIWYPHINEFVRLLHSHGISSFLVSNAQFPDRVQQLQPVTQLYLSIDAATAQSLKQIDRPLFRSANHCHAHKRRASMFFFSRLSAAGSVVTDRDCCLLFCLRDGVPLSDYWQRFLACLRALRAKRQRTVYRLTLVKSFNTTELADYAALVAIGRPTLIEIKGVTYCGTTSAANDLSMANVPFHSEVRAFSAALCEHINAALTATSTATATADSDAASYLDGYELACEHQHSCCVLLASRRMRRPEDGQWMTHIDYDSFIRCVQRWERTNGEVEFTASDYWAPTPHWALYDSTEAGFNPTEQRVLTTRPGNRSRQQLEDEWLANDTQQRAAAANHSEHIPAPHSGATGRGGPLADK